MAGDKDEERRRDAERTLERMGREGDTMWGAMARLGGRSEKADDEDTIEVWGRRIGRGLGLIFLVYLLYVLFVRGVG